MNYQTCIIIAADKALPNILPLLDPGFSQIKRLVIALSPEMKEKSVLRQYEHCFKGRNLDVVVWDLPENSFDSFELMASFEQLFQKYGEQACLNATCGTKLMLLAAYQEAQIAQIPAFYIDYRHDRLIWIDKETPDIHLADKIKFEHYLHANDYELLSSEKPKVSRNSRELTQWLVDNCVQYEKAIGQLNRLCSQAADDERKYRRPVLSIRLDHRSSDELKELLGKFCQHEMIQTSDGHTWHFEDEAQRDYANGIWMEEYCYLQLAQHKEKLQDYRMSLEVKRFGSKFNKNEIDGAFLFNNSPYFIECKTLRFSESKGASILYKSDSLKEELGGLRAKSIILSYRPLKAAHKERAEALGIEVFDASRLKLFKNYLEQLHCTLS